MQSAVHRRNPWSEPFWRSPSARVGEHLERLAAAVEYRVGEGRVVLIGFRPQHRAQPHRTFKLLFNAFYRLQDE